MPLTDSYGQNVTYPALTDKPNAQTMGQGIVDGIVPRTVMRFPSASVRGATITKPIAGMVTWLEDVSRLEVFDGTSWVAFAFGTNSWKTIPLASGWSHLSAGGDQGTFQYRVVNLFGEASLMFRGGISRSSYPSQMPESWTLNSTLLPTEARPANKRVLIVPCSDQNSDRISMRLEVMPSGELKLWGTSATAKPPWIGFNGVFASL